MAKNLVIVESPAKAKTIQKYLGNDFEVKSSMGHIRDLPTDKMAIDLENTFEPTYVVSDNQKKNIRELKKHAKSSELVWLATDEDREGEAIAWHILDALGLEEKNTRRIVFHEITKKAILHAVDNPRSIDYNLVNTYKARRVLDRIVGYELSPVLWKKVKGAKSAGRVQSVAVRLIVEREKEISSFIPEKSYKVAAEFSNLSGSLIKADLDKKFSSKDEAIVFLKKCINAQFSVSDIKIKPHSNKPKAPFTTSTLQQDASSKLGFSVARTMQTAQKLYEAGHITYMRTDSVNLSNQAVTHLKTEIENRFGKEYFQTWNYATKTKGAQEAHEAIRPTTLNKDEVGADEAQKKLYKLIWRRTLASQMTEEQVEQTTVKISISNTEYNFIAKGRVVLFDGFRLVYKTDLDSANKDELPKFNIRDPLHYSSITANESFTKHTPRFTEATLVKKLEELGIGRPSTYAPTISTIINRKYVVKDSKEPVERNSESIKLMEGELIANNVTEKVGHEKGKLFPSDIGKLLTGFLVEYFELIMNYNFTATVEEEFDKIANGNKQWNEMIKSFYGDFHKKIEEAKLNAKRTTGERILGEDPNSGRQLSVKIGPYGPMAQIGTNEEEEKPKFASLLKNQNIDDITFEEALNLFNLPRIIGKYEGEEVVAAIGRYGPYIRHNSVFISIGKEDPLSINMETAIELINAKKEFEKNRVINTFDNNGKKIQILNGRYGPYIKADKNYKIPKTEDPKNLSLDDCMQIMKKAKK